jgi:hypothetical protein
VSEFFGEPWPSGVCEDDGVQVETPIGQECELCEEQIAEGDQGSFMGGWRWGTGEPAERVGVKSPVHRECSLRAVLGGIGHLTDHVGWCTELHDPDGGMSYRQSAIAVWAWVQENRSRDIPWWP